MMKIFLIVFFNLFFVLNVYSNSKDLLEETVLAEIKKTFISEYLVSKSFWNDLKRSGHKSRAIKKNQKINKVRNSDWMSSKINKTSSWRKLKNKKIKSWKRKKINLMNQWIKERSKFNKRIPTYKRYLYSFESFEKEKTSMKDATKRINSSKYRVIPHAFTPLIFDQGKRPTCSAVALKRAIEILLSRKQKDVSVSPQYLYFASKPYCQKSPCSKKGSWPLTFLKKSKRSKHFDIPRLKDCSYRVTTKRNNETQIPLVASCFKGKYKINSYKKVKSYEDIIETLKKGFPVIGGVKLSANFYKNNGAVLFRDSKLKGKLDSHKEGHALLFVGYLQLPKSLNEGSTCLLTANSWGVGWGIGGFSCLSERWIKEYSIEIPFLSITSVI